MDEELKQFLTAQFANVDAKFTNVEHLIENTKESLEREVGQVRDLMTDIQRCLDRQAGLIQTGARHTTRMITWSEQVDRNLEDLKMRLQILENKRNGGA